MSFSQSDTWITCSLRHLIAGLGKCVIYFFYSVVAHLAIIAVNWSRKSEGTRARLPTSHFAAFLSLRPLSHAVIRRHKHTHVHAASFQVVYTVSFRECTPRPRCSSTRVSLINIFYTSYIGSREILQFAQTFIAAKRRIICVWKRIFSNRMWSIHIPIKRIESHMKNNWVNRVPEEDAARFARRFGENYVPGN